MRNYFTSLRALGMVLLSSVLLFSCNQIETFEGPDLNEAQERILFNFKSTNPNARMHKDMFTCNDVETTLLAGQSIPVGKVHAYNDLDSLYINVTIEGDYLEDWVIRKLNLFVGQTELVFLPVGNGKSKATKGAIINPAPGKFPFPSDIDSENIIGVQEYYFALPIGGGDEKVGVKDFGEIDIAVQADVVRVENIQFNDNGEAVSGYIAQSEGAWAEGERFNPEGLANWSMFFSYTVTECEQGECNPNWSRNNIVISGDNGNIDYVPNPDDELEVTYVVNGDQGNRVGEVAVRRTGNAGSPKFEAIFTPDSKPGSTSKYKFTELSMCVTKLNGEGEECSSSIVEEVNSEGEVISYTLELDNAPYTIISSSTNPSGNVRVLTSGSKIALTAVSDACNK